MDDLEVNVKDIVTDIIEDEKVSMSIDESKPIDISEDAKANEQELEKIAPIDDSKALKTQSANKKWLGALIFVLINVLAIVFTILLEFLGDDHPTNIHDAWLIFKQNWGWGIAAIALVVVAIISEALKRYILLYKSLNKKLPLTSLNATILCKYYNNITPLAGGGQPFEIYYLRKKGVPVGIASGVTLVSYALTKIAYVFVSIVFIAFCGFGNVSTTIKVLAIIGIASILLVPLAIICFTIMPRVSTAVSRFVAKVAKKLHLVKDAKAFEDKLTANIVEYADCISYFLQKSKMSIAISFICSVVYYLALYSLPYFVVRLCGTIPQDSWAKMFTYCIICYATVALLPTPGGSGGAEVSFRSIFAGCIATEGMVLWGIFSWRLLGYYSFIALGIVLITAQQVLKFGKKVVKGEFFEPARTEEEIPEEDQLELYTPVPTTQPDEDEINSAEVLVLTETTIEEELPTAPTELEVSKEATETVIEFTAVIESKSTVKITEEKIEVNEHAHDHNQELHDNKNANEAESEKANSENTLIEKTEGIANENLSETTSKECVQPITQVPQVESSKPSLTESSEQDLPNEIDVENQSTIEDLKQTTVIVEENTPNETVIIAPVSQPVIEEQCETCDNNENAQNENTDNNELSKDTQTEGEAKQPLSESETPKE